MPCIEVLPGRCEFELVEINKNCVKRVFWSGTHTDVTKIETLGQDVYVAGVFDFQPSRVFGLEYVPHVNNFDFCALPTFNTRVVTEMNEKISNLTLNETTCVHWRQEDFRSKGIEFVSNVMFASRSIQKYAKKFNTNTVLLLTNDPSDDVEQTRLAWLLGNLTRLRLRTHTIHHESKNAPKSIAIDKAACVRMEGFVGTEKSSFSDSILAMRDARRGETPLACVEGYARDGNRGTETRKDVLL